MKKIIACLSLLFCLITTVFAQLTTSQPIVFYLHPDVAATASLSTIRANLVKYVEDMNFILAKNTQHSVTFTPATGLIVTSTPPYDGSEPIGGAPRIGYEIRVYIRKSTTGSSYGGSFSMDSSGAAALTGSYWPKTWNPASLPNQAAFRDYRQQLTALLHSYGYVFGVAVEGGDISKLVSVLDTTQIAPITDMHMFSNFETLEWNYSDSYWGANFSYQGDPMVTAFPSTNRADMLRVHRFSGLSAAIIRENYRGWTHRPPITKLTSMRLTVLDKNNCRPVTGAQITIWRVGERTGLVGGVVTPSTGQMFWDWKPIGSLSTDPVRLIKISAPGYVSKAVYLTGLDLTAAAVLDGQTNFTSEVYLSRPKLTISIARSRSVTVSNVVAGQPFFLQASDNLSVWNTLTTVNPTSTTNFVYTHPAGAQGSYRFYRTSEETLCPIF